MLSVCTEREGFVGVFLDRGLEIGDGVLARFIPRSPEQVHHLLGAFLFVEEKVIVRVRACVCVCVSEIGCAC